jgi:hypothetical protein
MQTALPGHDAGMSQIRLQAGQVGVLLLLLLLLDARALASHQCKMEE